MRSVYAFDRFGSRSGKWSSGICTSTDTRFVSILSFQGDVQVFADAALLAPSTLIGLLANIINATFNWSLIYLAGWGISGSPWATTLTRTTEFALICLYMAMKRNSVLEETWPTISCENLSLEQVRPFMQIALTGALAFLGKFSPSLLIRFYV